ncbi:MAG: crossover junction endodeoxyribonuclease RuvC [Acidobacteriota bacterium]|nr:crossover junction endodeoxyribonuclease RuvC [Acidobacteriota bacterium]
MRVLGIDCGSEVTGYGVVEPAGKDGDLRCVAAGAIRLTGSERLPARLARVFDELRAVIERHHPDAVAIEEVFYAANAKSALRLGHVRGVAMLAAASCGIEVAEYAPLTVKSAVVGYGMAEKVQVQEMVMRLLKLEKRPEPPDVADALAIAICHLHTSATLLRQHAGAP